MLITTESGSVYRIDLNKKLWARISETERSGDIRTHFGTYTELRDVEVGKRMTIIAPGLAFGNRWIHTSVVKEIKDA